MLRIVTLMLPFILKRSTRGPIKNLIGRSAFSALVFFGFLFMLAALFVWAMATYSIVVAFLMLAVLFLGGAVFMKYAERSNNREMKKALPGNLEHGPLGEYLPPSIANDPIVQKTLTEVSKHPLPAAAIAVVAGALLARSVFK